MHKESLGWRLSRTARKLGSAYDSKVCTVCSAPQCRIMCFLAANGNECPQKAIEEAFLLTRPAVSQLLDHLEEAGFVERTVSESDRRMRKVRLLSKGVLVCRQSAEAMDAFEEKLFSILSADEKGRLCDMLDRIYRKLEDLE